MRYIGFHIMYHDFGLGYILHIWVLGPLELDIAATDPTQEQTGQSRAKVRNEGVASCCT